MGDWFKQTFGFKEFTGTNYRQTPEHFQYDPDSGILTSDACEKPFKAGKFKRPNLAELQKQVNSEQPPEALNGKLQVREVLGDVSEFHVNEDNNGATFMAASQFNCLEHPSERGLPEDGITCYSGDRTQGPACAIACAPGTIVRNYYGFDNGKSPQGKNFQVENLDEVEKALDNKNNNYFNVVSGYTMANSLGLQKLAKALQTNPSLKNDVMEKLKIGVQEDTQVTSWGFGRKLVDMPDQLVTQAYCSAISVSYSRCSEKDWEPFARLILESAYMQTMYVAAQNAMRNGEKKGSRKVFLTALGGGVFGNDMEWIRDAMSKAFDTFRAWNFEVYIVSFRDSERLLKELER
eukprot:TRINITY_DN3946_c0_g1_i1.p1 TRINITY_DN3946_c0_g1~~TRINITY_DN3946_c0_g1_i1.p1  ORF type:complete len:349 (+),score=88.70 TRINITY_DN3946_c0_g1_i1:79-1125(+)